MTNTATFYGKGIWEVKKRVLVGLSWNGICRGVLKVKGSCFEQERVTFLDLGFLGMSERDDFFGEILWQLWILSESIGRR